VFSNRSVLLLTVSYVCLNYVFYLLSNWCFLYLVQERHFNILEGGGLAMIPPLAAGVGAGIGGKVVPMLCERFGSRWGFRLRRLAPGRGEPEQSLCCGHCAGIVLCRD
jgi:ACS family glucarate transporter-like MFS transporter